MQQNNEAEYNNPYPQFDPNQGHGILNEQKTGLNEVLLSKLKQAVSQYTNTVNKASEHMREYSVYTGIAGIALLNFMLSQRFNNSTALQKAYDLLKTAPLKVPKSSATFLMDSGPVAISAVLSHHVGKTEDSMKCVSKLASLSSVISSDSDMPDELLYGRAGYLYSLLFVKKHIGTEAVEQGVIKQVVSSILKSGVARSKAYKSSVPLVFEWYGDNYYGAAHGVAGILYILLKTGFLTSEEKTKLVKPTLNDLLTKRLQSGNFPTSEGSRSDRLIQWCHGAPGFAELLATAYKEYGDERYYHVLLECGDVVWNRGLTTKGYSICHGVSGNAYIFLQLYQLTEDVKHLYRAGCFAHWCLTLPNHQQLQPDTPFSLFEGLAGVTYFLADIQHPTEAGFPAYNLQL